MTTGQLSKVPKVEPGGISTEAARLLRVPKVEAGGIDFSPKSVICHIPIELSSSSASERRSDSDSSSHHSDRSDSEVDYVVESEDDEDEFPVAKKHKTPTKDQRKKSWGEEQRRKSRTKTTAKRNDGHALARRKTNPGRRTVGRRIYDSVLGKTCHWCRQKTVELHVECSRCPIRFCGMCLLNRNGEVVLDEMMKNVRWVCPKCRGGCGPGCKNCCNCGPCRKSQDLEPTGQLIATVRRAGFDNVHDYLVHQATNEDPEIISRRKDGRAWTKATGALVYVDQEEEEEEEEMKPKVKKEYAIPAASLDLEDGHAGSQYKKDVSASKKAGKGAKSGPNVISNKLSQHRNSQDTESIEVLLRTKLIDSIHVLSEPDDKRYQKVYRKAGRLTKDSASLRNPVGSSEPHMNQKDSETSISACNMFAKELTPVDFTIGAGASRSIEGHDFITKLGFILQRPFSMPQLKQMLEHVNFRKTVMTLRQTRGRSIEIPGSAVGLSYLDYYPDLAEHLVKASLPEEKLKLLRGFFFWLQHSCMEGSFRPWVETVYDDTGECMEISGPDCQIIRVLLAIDENEDPPAGEVGAETWEDRKPVIQVEGSLPHRKTDAIRPSIIQVKKEKEEILVC